MFVEHYLPSRESEAVQNVQSVVGDTLEQGRHWDPGYHRPYFDSNNRPVVAILTNRWSKNDIKNGGGERRRLREVKLISDVVNNYGIMSPVFNATSLRKEEWIELDRTVLEAARYRLRAWGDLESASSYGGFDGMNKMLLEQETMSDPGEAIVDMDALTEGRTDAPKFQLEGLPLPITHADFWFSKRRLGISSNSGTRLDTRMAGAAAQRVAESVEKTLIGNNTGVTYGGNSTQVGGYGRATSASVYGYLNFPTRLTKINLTLPTGSNPDTTLAEVLAMKDSLTARKMYGPFMIYHSTDWDQYMDNDYARLGGNNPTTTLRNRLKAIDGISDVRRLDMLFASQPQTDPYYSTATTVGTTGKAIYTGPGGEGINSTGAPFTLLMVQMIPTTVQAVSGLPLTTVQWETKGGMQLNFKVMTIKVPRLQADFYGNCGIMQGLVTGGYTPA